jgi:hypothetical protein
MLIALLGFMCCGQEADIANALVSFALASIGALSLIQFGRNVLAKADHRFSRVACWSNDIKRCRAHRARLLGPAVFLRGAQRDDHSRL